MDHILCPSCEGWVAHPEDRVCGNCREILLKATAVIVPAVIYNGIPKPNDIDIMITKKNGNFSGTEFSWRRIRDKKEIRLDDISFPSSVPNGSPIDLKCSFDKFVADNEGDDQEDTWELIHQVINGYESILGALRIGQTIPKLALENSVVLLTDKKDNAVLQLTNKKGSCFSIIDLFITQSGSDTTQDLPIISEGESQHAICEGETINIPLTLSKTFVDKLDTLPMGIPLLLNIKSKDLPIEGSIVEPPPKFTIRIQKPAQLILEKGRGKITALQQGRLTLPLIIENRGGEACTIEGFNIQIVLLGEASINIPYEISPITLDIGKNIENNIKISLNDIDLPEGKHFLNIDILTSGKGQNSDIQGVQFELDIKKTQPYLGIVVIDFGSTASAAAYYDRAGVPVSVPLSEDGKLPYIPTAIAYYLNSRNELELCIGQEAQDKFHQLPNKRVRFLDNLKWRLNETSSILLPDKTEKQWWEVAADYLNIIKQRIEDDPNIIGFIEKVCITQPARFDLQLSDLLCRAYNTAGMQPTILHSVGQPVNAISESWPASILGMKGKEVLSWQQSYLGEQWNPCSEQYLWLNFDMGGGSTDLSLMTIDVDGFDHMKVKEIACEGDNNIAGNLISNLIYKHICFVDTNNPEEMFEINMDDYPIILPWDDEAKNLTNNEAAILNGHSVLEKVIFPIQMYGDIESGIIQATFDNIFRQEGEEVQQKIEKIWLDPEQLDEESLTKVIDGFTKTVAEMVKSRSDLSVTLNSIHGAENKLTNDQIIFDTRAFLKDFINDVSLPLYKKIQSILSRVPDSDDSQQRKLLLMMTGRGSMFPMVKSMIEAYFTALKEKHTESDIQGVTGDNAKTIVCEGACHIAHLLTSQTLETESIKFEPLPTPKFGFLNGKDKETGEYCFAELAKNIPNPKDGWSAIKYPVHAGENDINITFCQNLNNKETFIPEEKNCYNIQGRINFTLDDAKNTYLLVRMLDDGKLEANIGLSPENESTPNYEQWEKKLLGTYQLLLPPK